VAELFCVCAPFASKFPSRFGLPQQMKNAADGKLKKKCTFAKTCNIMSTIEQKFIARLAEFERLQIRSSINYDKMNAVLISHHSTAIEGSSLTLEEARLLLTEGLTAKGKPLDDHNMVRDHQQALEAVVAMAKQRQKISPQLVQNIAAMVMKSTGQVINAAAGSFDSSKGEWRKLAVHVGGHYFTSYPKVEREVAALCKLLNERNKPAMQPVEVYDLAFDAHFGLVSIHPFADGNGRTSRLLMNYILAYHHLPMAVLYAESKLEYHAVLRKNQEGEDVNLQELRDFMYGQQIRFFEEEVRQFTTGVNTDAILRAIPKASS
jgi:Fic family protein